MSQTNCEENDTVTGEKKQSAR